VSFQSASNILDDLGEAASDSASAERLKTWTGHVQKYRDFEATLQKLKGRNEAFATIEGKQAVSDATGLGADLANAGEAFNRQLEATTIAEFLATKHCASLKILRRTKVRGAKPRAIAVERRAYGHSQGGSQIGYRGDDFARVSRRHSGS